MTWELWLLCSAIVAAVTNPKVCSDPAEPAAVRNTAKVIATGGILLGPLTLLLMAVTMLAVVLADLTKSR